MWCALVQGQSQVGWGGGRQRVWTPPFGEGFIISNTRWTPPFLNSWICPCCVQVYPLRWTPALS